MSDLKERIAAANDMLSIYDLIEQVDDRTRPRKIHCPAHDDRTKSAQVYPESNSIYCFTEGRSYDPVGLVAEEQSIGVGAACLYIERMAGVRWVRQERDEDDFWVMARRAMANPDDETFWSRRQTILFRWEVHRSVLELVSEPDWEGFDSAHLDVGALREWRDVQLDVATAVR